MLHEVPKYEFFIKSRKSKAAICCGFSPQMTPHDVHIHMRVLGPQMTLHHIPGFPSTFVSHVISLDDDVTPSYQDSDTQVASDHHEGKNFDSCMTSSESKM